MRWLFDDASNIARDCGILDTLDASSLVGVQNRRWIDVENNYYVNQKQRIKRFGGKS